MGRTAAAARSVVTVVMAMAVASVLGVFTADSDDPCQGGGWLERDGAGLWSLISAKDTRTQHPPVAVHLSWGTLKDTAHSRSTRLRDSLPQDGTPLPLLTCNAPSVPCRDIVSTNASCPRVVRRALCIAVGGECQALMVTVEEPLNCCCGLEERSTKLTGKVINMWLTKPCPPSFNNATEKRERKAGGETRGVPLLSSERSTTLPSLHVNNTTNDGNSNQVETSGEIIEKHVKDNNIFEDAIAALVFLFVGAVLVLIKSRLFRFTKKKVQQEDRDTESEETLVDETII